MRPRLARKQSSGAFKLYRNMSGVNENGSGAFSLVLFTTSSWAEAQLFPEPCDSNSKAPISTSGEMVGLMRSESPVPSLRSCVVSLVASKESELGAAP